LIIFIEQVAGGLCDNTLGRSFVKLKMQGCSTWPGKVLEQTYFRGTHEVIAQIVELKLEAITSLTDNSTRQVLVDAFPDIRTADLRRREDSAETTTLNEDNVLPNTTRTQEAKDDQANESAGLKTNLVRFQHNGTDVIKPTFGNMKTGSCAGVASGYNTYSYHVVPKLDIMIVAIEVFQDFGYPDIKVCTKYPAETNITINNYVGALNTTIEQQWVEELKATSYSQQVDNLLKCNPSCTRTLQFDANGEGAYWVEAFLSGQPNPASPFFKNMMFTMVKSGRKHISEVIVTGGTWHT
jgi:hypothetical protein